MSARLSAVILRLALGCALSTVAVACSPNTFIIATYPGPVRPRETIAIVRVEGSSTALVLALDDQPLAPVSSDARLHLEVLPGRHTLTAQSSTAPNEPPQHLAFEAQAGKLYRVAFVSSAQPGRLEARVFEVDADSGASRADVTASSR